jgi:hypothetical protein
MNMSGQPRHQPLPADRHSGVSSITPKSHDTRKDQLAHLCRKSQRQRISTRGTQTVRMAGTVQERGSMPSVADRLQSKAESQQRSSSALKPTCTFQTASILTTLLPTAYDRRDDALGSGPRGSPRGVFFPNLDQFFLILLVVSRAWLVTDA